MKHAVIIAVAVACYSLQDLRNARCEVACLRSGYDTGYFKADKCWCVETKDYDRVTGEKKLILPRKSSGAAIESPVAPKEDPGFPWHSSE